MTVSTRVFGFLFFLVSTPSCAIAAGPDGSEDLKKSREELIRQTEAYVEQVRQLLTIEQSARQRGEERVFLRRKLFEDGLIARVELEQSETELQALDRRISRLLQDIRISQELVAEVYVALEGDSPPGSDAVIRYAGDSHWSLATVSKIKAFFEERFGQALPVSAYGQTELHNRFGLMHSTAVDIALHPDSVEGRILLEYLRKAGLPFIAFRAAVRGSATGAHIHVGPPSQRIHLAI
jgi:hypothetical protein